MKGIFHHFQRAFNSQLNSHFILNSSFKFQASPKVSNYITILWVTQSTGNKYNDTLYNHRYLLHCVYFYYHFAFHIFYAIVSKKMNFKRVKESLSLFIFSVHAYSGTMLKIGDKSLQGIQYLLMNTIAKYIFFPEFRC